MEFPMGRTCNLFKVIAIVAHKVSNMKLRLLKIAHLV